MYGLIGSHSPIISHGGEIVVIEATFLGYQYISCTKIFTILVLFCIIFSEINVLFFFLLGLFSTCQSILRFLSEQFGPPEGSCTIQRHMQYLYLILYILLLSGSDNNIVHIIH